MHAKIKFDAFKAQRVFSSDQVLLDFFDSLPPVRVDEIQSIWAGGDFDTGHWATRSLDDVKWFGKWFRSASDAMPLVCYDDKGNLYSNKMMKGEASLWQIAFRGKISATMVYDGVPIFDHFRKVDDDTLLGIMDGKSFEGAPDIVQDGHYYFFYLERIDKMPAPFIDA